MKQVAMIVDVEKCVYCNSCFLADKDEHVGNDWPPTAIAQPAHGHRWIDIRRKERGAGTMIDVANVPTMCNHCRRPRCLPAGASDAAVYQRPDGIVIIDPVKARGRRDLVDACPYGHIWWNDDADVPQKWTMNAHLLDQGWKEPRCTQTCATGALTFLRVTDAELARLDTRDDLAVLHPEWDTSPRVFYKNLHRFNRAFVGGSLATTREGHEECVPDVGVELRRDGAPIDRTASDVFGEFKFDGLVEESGPYEIVISPAGTAPRTIPVRLGVSTCLGVITL